MLCLPTFPAHLRIFPLRRPHCIHHAAHCSRARPACARRVLRLQADTDPAGHGTGHPFLAINGDTDSFALCMAGSQNNIVYKPVTTSTVYDATTCQEVKVQIIF